MRYLGRLGKKIDSFIDKTEVKLEKNIDKFIEKHAHCGCDQTHSVSKRSVNDSDDTGPHPATGGAVNMIGTIPVTLVGSGEPDHYHGLAI